MQLFSRYPPGNYSDEQFNLDKRVGGFALFISVTAVALLWLIKLIEFEYSLDFSSWGIMPRSIKNLHGILFSPLIHANFDHLAANSFPLPVLLFSLFFFYRKPAGSIFVLIYLFSGLLVWLGGRQTLHIGASGVIYGLAAFLFLSGVIGRDIRLLTISLVVAFLYGGLLWGIFPVKPEISWESHLWGGISGFALAILFRNSGPSVPIPFEEEEEDEQDGEWRMATSEDDPDDSTPV